MRPVHMRRKHEPVLSRSRPGFRPHGRGAHTLLTRGRRQFVRQRG
jgi:hypothetical protein